MERQHIDCEHCGQSYPYGEQGYTKEFCIKGDALPIRGGKFTATDEWITVCANPSCEQEYVAKNNLETFENSDGYTYRKKS